MNNVTLQKTYDVWPTSNCLLTDLGARPQGDYNIRFCQKFNLRLYISNYGTATVSSFKIKIELGGNSFDTLVTSNIGTGSSVFVDFNNLYLEEGENNLKGYVYLPNNTADIFNVNDTFKMVLTTRFFPNIKLTGQDSICENQQSKLVINGPAGTYSRYFNNNLIAQSSTLDYWVQSKGKYYVLYTDSGCIYSSDTFELHHFASPIKPKITQNGNSLSTDADDIVYWYFNGVAIDSLTKSIVHKGAGIYKVRNVNSYGCFSESDNYNLTTGSLENMDSRLLKLLNNQYLIWKGTEPIDLKCFDPKGHLIKEITLQPGIITKTPLEAGVYFIQYEYESYVGVIKALILN